MIKKHLKKIVPDFLLHWYRQIKMNQWKSNSLKKALEMEAEENVNLSRIATVIVETISGTLTDEEKQAISKIEDLRYVLGKDKTKILVNDFGAGDPNLRRTEQEMLNGIINTKSLSEIVKASKPSLWASMLFKLVREFKPKKCIELGTCVGISAAYQGTALKLNGEGQFITIEGSSSIASIADENMKLLNLETVQVVAGRFQDKLPLILNENRPIDYVFIDGHHDEKATISYFEMIIPSLSENALLVFDDISWSSGMKRAWQYIIAHDKVRVAVDLSEFGICILDSSKKEKRVYSFPFFGRKK